jgi:2'-5' RNA ligase
MRLFIATSFPAEILKDLDDRVSRFRTRLPPATWVKPETQHLTFAFLGDRPESLATKITPDLTDTLSNVPSFEAKLRGCGFFPNARHARVGWIGLLPEAPFIEIANIVRERLTQLGVKLDGSDFKPHLTMMRMREGWPPASLELFSRSLRDYESAPIQVDAVTLFNSELHPQGAIHTAVARFSLA